MWHKDEVAQIAHQTFFGRAATIEHMHGNLHANLHVPPNFDRGTSEGYPAVLMLHGLGGNRHEFGGLFIKAAATFARAGMVALRPDFRGAGETGGSTRDITIKTQVQDANDCFEYLKSLPYTDPKKIAVLGFSFGGLTAACLSGQRDDVAALVLWQAAHDMKATMKRICGHLSLRAIRARGYLQAGMMQLGTDFFDALDDVHPDKQVSGYRNPVLIVQGVADTIVPVDTAYQWKRAFAGTKVEVDLIQDADHTFSNDVWSWNAIDRSATWLQSTLHSER